MIEDQFKYILTNARSYQGTLTFSDHRIVIISMQIGWHIIHKQKKHITHNKKQKFDTHKLVNNAEMSTISARTIY